MISILLQHMLQISLLVRTRTSTALLLQNKWPFLYVATQLIFHTKTKCILTILILKKNHLKKSHFTFVTRLRPNDRPSLFLSHVCSGFNIFVFAFSFASMYQPPSARHSEWEKPFVALKQNILWNCIGFKTYNKTYCLPAAPLTFSFSFFLIFFGMCLWPPWR